MAVRILFFGFFGGNLPLNLLFFSPKIQLKVLSKVQTYSNLNISIKGLTLLVYDSLVLIYRYITLFSHLIGGQIEKT